MHCLKKGIIATRLFGTTHLPYLGYLGCFSLEALPDQSLVSVSQFLALLCVLLIISWARSEVRKQSVIPYIERKVSLGVKKNRK